MSSVKTCNIGSCLRHGQCMYSPCRSVEIKVAPSEPLESKTGGGLTVVMEARRSGKTERLMRQRIRTIARGGSINVTYGLPPNESLDAFRKDLLRLLGEA